MACSGLLLSSWWRQFHNKQEGVFSPSRPACVCHGLPRSATPPHPAAGLSQCLAVPRGVSQCFAMASRFAARPRLVRRY